MPNLLRSYVRRWIPNIRIASGTERHSGQAVRLTYVGNNFGFNTVANRLFSPGYKVENIGRHWLGFPGFPREVRADGSDIVATELNLKNFSDHDRGNGYFVPLWSQTTIPVLAARRQMKKSNSLKEDLRKARLNGIVCEYTSDKSLLRMYYNDFYCPHIVERNAELALLDSWEVVSESTASGCLILARNSAGEILGGATMWRQENSVGCRTVALSSRDPSIMRSGVSSALYLATIEWAESHGFD
ncbi:MAG: hypothetical protein AAF420_15155, partial [Pseudomonadota bacterium]